MTDGEDESRGGGAADTATPRGRGIRHGEEAEGQGRGDRAGQEAELRVGGARQEPVRRESDVAGAGQKQRGGGQRIANRPRAGARCRSGEDRPAEGGAGGGAGGRRGVLLLRRGEMGGGGAWRRGVAEEKVLEMSGARSGGATAAVPAFMPLRGVHADGDRLPCLQLLQKWQRHGKLVLIKVISLISETRPI